MKLEVVNNINNYIENACLNWENPPEIVGLVGDVGGTYNIDCDSYEWEVIMVQVMLSIHI